MSPIIKTLVFSKDRALQLEALLSSLFLNTRSSVEFQVSVLFKCTHPRHIEQYESLMKMFPKVNFVEETNFKKNVERIIEGCDFIGFLVDDTLFVNSWSLDTVVQALNALPRSCGFSLRLGQNINYCYPFDCPQKQPVFRAEPGGFYSYDWRDCEYDFGYPLEVSSSFYRARDLHDLIVGQPYTNPNEFEGMLARNIEQYSKTKELLLTFEKSVAFSCPINLVQDVNSNRFGTAFSKSIEDLAAMFDRGERIDIAHLQSIEPVSCHQEIELKFKKTSNPIE